MMSTEILGHTVIAKLPFKEQKQENFACYCLLLNSYLPATTESFFIALLTIIIASCKDLSVSSMNCSAPPLSNSVHVLACGQPVNKLYLKILKQWLELMNQILLTNEFKALQNDQKISR